MKQKTLFWKDETGSAILLSLGILSLVLILAMSFVFSANTQKAIAKVQGAASSARMIADEAVELTIADMRWMCEKTTYTEDNREVTEFTYLNNKIIGVYPPITMNDNSLDPSGYNQTCFLFHRIGTSDNRMNYLLSCDVGSGANTLDSDDFKSFGLDNLAKIDYLPQLKSVLSSLSSGTQLGFAPPLTIEYKLTDEGGNGTKTYNKVTGRYAYILLDETAKFDINSVISLTGDVPTAVCIYPPSETSQEDENQDLVLGGGTYCDRLAPATAVKEGKGVTYRYCMLFGKEISEINNIDKDSTGRYLAAQTLRLGLLPEEICIDNEETYRNHLSNNNKEIPPYESYNQLCAAGTGFGNAGNDETFLYTFFGLEDIEAYWVSEDTNGSGITEKFEGTEYQRFDLSGISWGNSTDELFDQDADSWEKKNAWEYGWDGDKQDQEKSRQLIWRMCGLNTDDKPNASPSVDKLKFWSDPSAGTRNYSVKETTDDISDYKGYLDWLHRMVDDGGDKVGVQVAANIKDFSDHDDYASTDFNFTEDAPTGDKYAKPEAYHEPNYCGNERVCYVNEVEVRQACWKWMNSSAEWEYNVSINVGIEMLNIYCLLDMAYCGDSRKKNSDGGGCTVPLGDVHVKVFGKLDITEQQRKLDTNSTSATYGDWIENTEVPQVTYSCTLNSGDDDVTPHLTMNSNDSNELFDMANNPLLNMPQHHLGFTSFYLKKTKTLKQLGEICKIPDGKAEDFFSTLHDKAQERQGVRYHYAFVFTIDRVVVYTTKEGKDDIEHLYDVAVMPKANSDTEFTADKGNFKTNMLDSILNDKVDMYENYQFIVNFQARDCRLNHRADREKFWVVRTLQDDGSGTPEKNWDLDNKDDKTESKVYKVAKEVNAAYDMEEEIEEKEQRFKKAGESEQKTFSTAFIRNAPMESLWELGAIHRGYPYQTINLKDYTKNTGNIYYSKNVSPGGGDAGILDQVKIGPLMFVKGKINANQRNYMVWEKLLTDIRYDWYDCKICDDLTNENVSDLSVVGVDKNGWKITKTDVELLLKSGNAWNNYSCDYLTSTDRGVIACMLQELLMKKENKPANDRDYESYIGKTAGLLTTRGEAYSLLLVAEALNDVTDDVKQEATLNNMTNDGMWALMKQGLVKPVTVKAYINGAYEDRYCTVTGRQKVLVHLLRDAWRNEITVHSKRYLGDE